MAEETSQEKTEQATPKRKQDSKDKGQVARSRDLSTAFIIIAGSASLIMFGEYIGTGLSDIMRESFQFDHNAIFNDRHIFTTAVSMLNKILYLLAPILLVLFLAALIGPISIGGLSISGKALMPKAEKLNLLKGLKKLFAVKGLVELVKSLLKFIVIGAFSGSMLWAEHAKLLSLGFTATPADLIEGLTLLAWLSLGTSCTLLIISAFDVPYQIWEHSKQLKMTKQEVKDEMKDSEGKPEVKGHIRRTQQEMAQQRMMNDIPDADVVITNPTHYSVALKYDDNSPAPRVVARGKDLIAFQIRKIAAEHDVEILPAPALARAIFFSTKLNEQIPHGLYVAVAQVLAYVYQLKLYRKGKASKPKDIAKFDIPDDYKR